ncbi:helix-turn-helix domain-containing protein [Hafnia alvei]|uniref:NadS family protein n=1 Tax=Hafnia alvei TaxID=569 RepID=UPI002DBE04C2|nr:NadS family protein [Hafnia alvei]MEB7891881.1 helix-turn-helix domain-containing protein [Hafnia alvei]
MEQKLFEQLVTSMNEMVAIENGEMQPLPEHVHRHAIPDVKSLRSNAGMSQAEFAEMIGASTATVQSWELARRVPSGMALRLLCLIERNPNVVDTLRTI